MLDDPKYYEPLDHHDALGMVRAQLDQLKNPLVAELSKPDRTLTNIVVAGMGGSALAAEFIRSWLGDRLPLPLNIVRDYTLPKYVNESTLLIVSSYSGNTEETVAAAHEGVERGAFMVANDDGGKLAELAAEHHWPMFKLPDGFQPRLAVLAGVRAMLSALVALEIVGSEVLDEMTATAEWMVNEITAWEKDSPVDTNAAKQLANGLTGFPVVVYAGPTLAFAAMKWKIDINENAKNVAFWNQLPEFNHNEFQGWSHPRDKAIKVIELLSHLDHERVQKRFVVANRLLSGQMPAAAQIHAKGDTKLQQMVWTVLLGDYMSMYLGFLNQIDPIPVDMVEKFKKELDA
jgi:glucose/mannose-6-phosphate isomerase